jgi:apolipoprotein N-acyltransferase
MRLALLFSLPVVSAILATLSLPSFHLGFLAWVALAPLLFALRQRGLAASAALGWLFGYAFGVGTFFWITTIPDLNATRFALLMAVFSLYYLAFGFLYALASRFVGSWLIFAGPALGVALEYARCNLAFLAYPWNFLSHSQYQTLPVIQIADLTGMYGVTFVLLMVNQFASQLPELLTARKWRWPAQALACSLVLAATLTYGWYHLAGAPRAEGYLRVALVQANVTARSNMSTNEQMKHLAAYDRLTRTVAKD